MEAHYIRGRRPPIAVFSLRFLTERILIELFVIFAAGKVAGEIFERLRRPPVIGELLVGVALGLILCR